MFEALIGARALGGFDEVQKVAAAGRGEKNHAGRMTKRYFEPQDIDVKVLGLFQIAHFESDVAQAFFCHGSVPP